MTRKKAPIGAVLVMGGGVGGIQSSLELAGLGYKVYLLDSSPSVGGVMGMLDKTFPTNECSMCILSPKMAECSQHANITLHTKMHQKTNTVHPRHAEVAYQYIRL